MRVLSYEEAKKSIWYYMEEPLQERGGLTSWDLSFAEYIEEHKNARKVSHPSHIRGSRPYTALLLQVFAGQAYVTLKQQTRSPLQTWPPFAR